jgi:predicted GH43/DUF377 family glycosyl hydrolase
MNRRQWLSTAAGSCLAAATLTNVTARADDAKPFRVHVWKRDERNPVLPPGGGSFDTNRCMNPFIVVHGDEYRLYYAGSDKQGRHRICLATCPIHDITQWKRLGPLFDPGGKDAFDESWCVLPCVHRFGDKWHMYYTGRSALSGVGLQGFWGIGLATSDDGIYWKKTSTDPIILGNGFDRWPNNRGVAGGGPIVELPEVDGRKRYRLYYSLCTGTPSKDLLVDQAKRSVIAHSEDGLTWTDKQLILEPRLDAPYENAATIALNPWKEGSVWRAIYAGIGTQFGAYSICEAESDDGVNWRRGKPGENLALAPAGKGWESKMTEYPHVVREGKNLRLFYCGNGYGTTGIGTATADLLYA